MEDLGLPIWVLAAAFLLNAFKGYLPTVAKLSSDSGRIKACNNKCDELSKEILSLKKDCLLAAEKYDDVNRKYYLLLGSMSVIKTKLMDLGFDDITMVTKESNGQ